MTDDQPDHSPYPAAAHVPDEHGMSHVVEGPHGAATDHGDGHGHDDHGHAAGTLGPIDWVIWGVGVLGVVVGVVIAAGFVAGSGYTLTG